jgi:hypothetical protein
MAASAMADLILHTVSNVLASEAMVKRVRTLASQHRVRQLSHCHV